VISNEFRQFVDKTFAQDLDFRDDVITALNLDRNLAHLGQNANRKPWEIAALKRIQQAHETGVVPDDV
jgi:hypothetical protein